jgi:hypothetical protein
VYLDIPDFNKIKDKNLSWYVNNNLNHHGFYAKATEYIGIFNGKPKYEIIRLHRYILQDEYNLNKNILIDHINHNTLDNRRSNLRITISEKNTKNRYGKNKNYKSGYRNVFWNKRENKWCVQLQICGKNTRLGLFDDIDEAGIFAEQMRQKYYGEFAGEN